MTPDEINNKLRDVVQPTRPDYWDQIDASLHTIAVERDEVQRGGGRQAVDVVPLEAHRAPRRQTGARVLLAAASVVLVLGGAFVALRSAPSDQGVASVSDVERSQSTPAALVAQPTAVAEPEPTPTAQTIPTAAAERTAPRSGLADVEGAIRGGGFTSDGDQILVGVASGSRITIEVESSNSVAVHVIGPGGNLVASGAEVTFVATIAGDYVLQFPDQPGGSRQLMADPLWSQNIYVNGALMMSSRAPNVAVTEVPPETQQDMVGG